MPCSTTDLEADVLPLPVAVQPKDQPLRVAGALLELGLEVRLVLRAGVGGPSPGLYGKEGD